MGEFDEFVSPPPQSTVPRSATPLPSASPYKGEFDEFVSPPPGNVGLHMKGGEPEAYDLPQPDAKKPLYHWWEALQAAYHNLPKDALRVGTGIKDAVIHPAVTGDNLLRLGVGLPFALLDNATGGAMRTHNSPGLTQMMDQANDEINRQRDKYVSEPGEPWFSALKRSVAETPVEVGMDMAPLAGPVAGRVVGAVAGPVAGRVASTVVNPLGAVNDAASAINTHVLPRVGNYLADVTKPTAALTGRAGQGRLNELNAALANPQQIVPNSPIRTGEAAVDVNAPNFHNLVRQAEQSPLNSHLARDTADAQQAARIEQTRTVGGTPDELAQREADLKAADDINYADADNPVTANKRLLVLLRSPSTRAAFQLAKDLAQEERKKFPAQPYKPPQELPIHDGQDPFTIPHSDEGGIPELDAMDPASFGDSVMLPEEWSTYRGVDMDRVKKAFDKLAFGSPELKKKYSVDGIDSALVQNTRDQFIRWLERENPAHRVARETSRDMRREIMPMQIGQGFEKELTDGGPLADFFDNIENRASSNPVVKKYTGMDYPNHLSDVLNPDQLHALESVRDDVARSGRADEMAAAGNGFGGALDAPVSDALGIDPANKVLNWLSAGLYNKGIKGANQFVGDRIGRQLLTPEGARQLIQQAIAHDASKDWWGIHHEAATRLNNLINPYGYANRFPTLYETKDQQNTNNKKR